MQLAIEGAIDGRLGLTTPTFLVIEISSYEAGVIAFLFLFSLMGIMFYILRTERDKTIPALNPLGPNDIVRVENPLSNSDAPYLAIITLVVLELILDGLIVVGVFQGTGAVAVGTMLAFAAFLAAAILVIYRSTFMDEAFTRKPRLEVVAAGFSETAREEEEHG